METLAYWIEKDMTCYDEDDNPISFLVYTYLLKGDDVLEMQVWDNEKCNKGVTYIYDRIHSYVSYKDEMIPYVNSTDDKRGGFRLIEKYEPDDLDEKVEEFFFKKKI